MPGAGLVTRTIPGPLAAALSASPRRAAECLVVEARDGTRARFTSWDRPLTIDLGLGDGAETCAAGMTLSTLTLTAGLDASSFEVEGPLRAPITRVAVLGGRWRSARAWLVRVSPGVAGVAPIMAGRVADYRVEGSRFVFEVRNAVAALNQVQGRVLSPYCDAQFGDARCGVARTPVACTVVAVESALRFTASIAGDHPDAWFNLGAAAFTTGALAGVEMEVVGYDGDLAVVELFEPLPEAPQVGDALNLYRGCSKLMIADDPDVPTCVSYSNGANHRGFREVPGSRFYHRVSAPGASYA